MEERLHIPRAFYLVCLLLIMLGLATLVYGFVHAPARTWANYLLNNYYFLAISIGAAFFVSLQYISQAGWSSGFIRVPESMMMYIPVAFVLFLILYFGTSHLYAWAGKSTVSGDVILQHRSGYLNLPFAFLRLIVFFGIWTLMALLIRKSSLRQDAEGGMVNFRKSEVYAKIFIFILAITYSLFTFDWMMSIEKHWTSTLFALKDFIASFYHGSAMVALIILYLNKRGKFPFLNKYHVHDLARYIFMLAIIYGYFWFSQFMLIWYGNIPEETIYYAVRWKNGWQALFYADIIVNWFLPFAILLPLATSRSKAVVAATAILLVFGFWIDLYLQIMPAITASNTFGLIEAGTFLGFAGLFMLVVTRTLASANLVPRNHPYIEESLHHEF